MSHSWWEEMQRMGKHDVHVSIEFTIRLFLGEVTLEQ